jgi:hypothetical protein
LSTALKLLVAHLGVSPIVEQSAIKLLGEKMADLATRRIANLGVFDSRKLV